jgi:hypothetical protein
MGGFREVRRLSMVTDSCVIPRCLAIVISSCGLILNCPLFPAGSNLVASQRTLNVGTGSSSIHSLTHVRLWLTGSWL